MTNHDHQTSPRSTTSGSPTTCPRSSSASGSPGAACSRSSAASGSPRSPAAPPTRLLVGHRHLRQRRPPERRAARRRWRRLGGDSSVEVAEGEIPEETAGPFPGDGTNGPNVLTESGVVRSDITTQLRRRQRRRRGRADDREAQGLRPERRRRDPARRRRDLPVALRPRRQLLDVRRRRAVRELPARRPGGRRRRHAGVHHDLPGLLRRPLAAHALRGLRVARRRDQRLEQAAHLAARAAPGRLRDGLRHRGLRAVGHRTSPRSASTATASSPTATRCRWPSSPARSRRGTSRR